MKTSNPRLLWVGIVAAVTLPAVHSQTSHDALLDQAESRLRAIYERDEFRPKRFRAEWLADSSGYTVMESVPDAKESVRVRYDVADGKRTVLNDSEQEPSSRSGQRSPDGASVLIVERGNLYVRHANSDQNIPLTRSAPDGPVSNHDAIWSPDGQWVAFVQTDESDVKLRSVLVPGDPSYPTVKEDRFARVGGVIPNTHLQIVEGLVDRLIELGKRFDYMAYPNRDHGLQEGRDTAVHVRMLMARYLIEHLPPGPR